MNIEKDYYAILGVLPSAEEIVIKAAYRALSKRYHPDVYKGPNLTEKMADINEAYETLSNLARKAEYDEARGVRGQDTDEYFNDDFGTHNTVDPLDADWKVAIKYHPDLKDAASRLTKYSKKVAYSYKAYMLEAKDFDSIHRIAKAMEKEFLKLHFGQNKQIILFAKELFRDGRKDILIELNQAIKVLGVSNADQRIIPKIKEEYQYYTKKERFNSWLSNFDGVEWLEGVISEIYHAWERSPSEGKKAAELAIIEAKLKAEDSKQKLEKAMSQRQASVKALTVQQRLDARKSICLSCIMIIMALAILFALSRA